MYAAGIPEQVIKEITGHRSDCVRDYKRTPDLIKMDASNAISVPVSMAPQPQNDDRGLVSMDMSKGLVKKSTPKPKPTAAAGKRPAESSDEEDSPWNYKSVNKRPKTDFPELPDTQQEPTLIEKDRYGSNVNVLNRKLGNMACNEECKENENCLHKSFNNALEKKMEKYDKARSKKISLGKLQFNVEVNFEK